MFYFGRIGRGHHETGELGSQICLCARCLNAIAILYYRFLVIKFTAEVINQLIEAD